MDNQAANTLAAQHLPEHIQISQLFNRFVTDGVLASKINALSSSANIATADRFVVYNQSSGTLQTATLAQITAGVGLSTYATPTAAGVVQLGTQAQVNTGTDELVVLTPLTYRTDADGRYLTQTNADTRYYTQTAARGAFLPLTSTSQDINASRLSGLDPSTHIGLANTANAGVVRFANATERLSSSNTTLVLSTADILALLQNRQYQTQSDVSAAYRPLGTALDYNDDNDIDNKPNLNLYLLTSDADTRYRLATDNVPFAQISGGIPESRITEIVTNLTRLGFAITSANDLRYRRSNVDIPSTSVSGDFPISRITNLQPTLNTFITQTTADGRYLSTSYTTPDINRNRIIGGISAALDIGGKSESVFTLPEETLTGAEWNTSTETDLSAWTTGNTSTTENAAARSGTDIILREGGAYYITIDGSFNIPLTSPPTNSARFVSDVEFRVYRDTDANQAGQIEEELIEDISNYRLGFDSSNFTANTGEARKEVTRTIYDYYPAGTRLRIRRRISNEFYDVSGTALGTSNINFGNDGSIGSFTIKVKKFNTSASAGLNQASADMRYRQLSQLITTTAIQDDAVTLEKMAPGTSGLFIGYDDDGNPAALAAPEGDLTRATADTLYRLRTTLITNDDIQNETIQGGKIASQTILGSRIASNAVGNRTIASNAITTDKIANGAITREKIASGVLPSTTGFLTQTTADGRYVRQQSNSIFSQYIQNSAITTAKIANNAVNASKLALNIIATQHLRDRSVTADKIAVGVLPDVSGLLTQAAASRLFIRNNPLSVVTQLLDDQAVTTAKLADNSVTQEKLTFTIPPAVSLATTTTSGRVRFANDAEVAAATSDNTATTPADVKTIVDNNTSPGNNGIGSHQYRFPIDTQTNDYTEENMGQAAEGNWNGVGYTDSSFNSFERFIIPDAWQYELGTGHTKISFTLSNTANTGYDGLVQRRVAFYRGQNQTGSLISTQSLDSVSVVDNATAPDLQVINVVVPAGTGSFAIELNHATDDTPNRSMTWRVSNLQLNYEAWEFAVSGGDLQITYPGGFRQDIAINEIESSSVADGSITTQKLADDAVTLDKIDSDDIATNVEVRGGIGNKLLNVSNINATRSISTEDTTMWKGSVVIRNNLNRTGQGFTFLDSWNFYPNVLPHTPGQTGIGIDYEIAGTLTFADARTGTITFSYTSSIDSYSSSTRQIIDGSRTFNVGLSFPQDNDRGRGRITFSRSSGSGGAFLRILRIYTT